MAFQTRFEAFPDALALLIVETGALDSAQGEAFEVELFLADIEAASLLFNRVDDDQSVDLSCDLFFASERSSLAFGAGGVHDVVVL